MEKLEKKKRKTDLGNATRDEDGMSEWVLSWGNIEKLYSSVLTRTYETLGTFDFSGSVLWVETI